MPDDPVLGNRLGTQKLLLKKIELFWSLLCFFLRHFHFLQSTLCFFGLRPVVCSLSDPVTSHLGPVYLPLLLHLRSCALLMIGENPLSHFLHEIVQILSRLPVRLTNLSTRRLSCVFRLIFKERALFFLFRLVRDFICALFFIEHTLFFYVFCRVPGNRFFCRQRSSLPLRGSRLLCRYALFLLRRRSRRLRQIDLRDQLIVVKGAGHSLADAVVDLLLVLEAHLHLGGVHVHIHDLRVHLDMKHSKGIFVLHLEILVGVLDGL